MTIYLFIFGCVPCFLDLNRMKPLKFKYFRVYIVFLAIVSLLFFRESRQIVLPFGIDVIPEYAVIYIIIHLDCGLFIMNLLTLLVCSDTHLSLTKEFLNIFSQVSRLTKTRRWSKNARATFSLIIFNIILDQATIFFSTLVVAPSTFSELFDIIKIQYGIFSIIACSSYFLTGVIILDYLFGVLNNTLVESMDKFNRMRLENGWNRSRIDFSAFIHCIDEISIIYDKLVRIAHKLNKLFYFSIAIYISDNFLENCIVPYVTWTTMKKNVIDFSEIGKTFVPNILYIIHIMFFLSVCEKIKHTSSRTGRILHEFLLSETDDRLTNIVS